MQPQVQQVQIPLQTAADVTFRLDLLIATDRSGYEFGKEGRVIRAHFMGPLTLEFVDVRADQFEVWFLNATGQARVAQ